MDARLIDFADVELPESPFRMLLDDFIDDPLAPSAVMPNYLGETVKQEQSLLLRVLPIHHHPGNGGAMSRTLDANQHLETLGEQQLNSNQEEQQQGLPPDIAAVPDANAATTAFDELDLAVDNISFVVVPEEEEILVTNPPNVQLHYNQQQQEYLGGGVKTNLPSLQNLQFNLPVLPPPAKQVRMDLEVQQYQALSPAGVMYASAPGPSTLPANQVKEVKNVLPAVPTAPPHFLVATPVKHLGEPLPRDSLHKESSSPSSFSSSNLSTSPSKGQKSNSKRPKLPKPERLGEEVAPILINMVVGQGQLRAGFQCADCRKCFKDLRCHNKHHRDIHRLYLCKVLDCSEVRTGYSRYNDHAKKAHGHVPKKIATKKSKAKKS